MSGAAACTPRTRWHREPLVWLLIAIPLSSVVMGVVMLWLSVSTYDGLVADDYYKRGLEIDRVLDRDRVAMRLGLSAELRLDAGGTRLLLEAGDAGLALPARLVLDFSYATRAGLDRRIVLSRVTPGDYAGPVLALRPGRWYVQAATADWRITGTLQLPGSARVRLGRPPGGS
jgi:hypothetical protein